MTKWYNHRSTNQKLQIYWLSWLRADHVSSLSLSVTSIHSHSGAVSQSGLHVQPQLLLSRYSWRKPPIAPYRTARPSCSIRTWICCIFTPEFHTGSCFYLCEGQSWKREVERISGCPPTRMENTQHVCTAGGSVSPGGQVWTGPCFLYMCVCGR